MKDPGRSLDPSIILEGLSVHCTIFLFLSPYLLMVQFLYVGFVSGLGQSLSKFKNSSSAKTPVHTHRRSRSMKAELMRNKVKCNLEENVLDRKSGNLILFV